MPILDISALPASFALWSRARRSELEQAIAGYLPAPPSASPHDPLRLIEAMGYATLGGGKRLRGLCVLAVYEALARDDERKFRSSALAGAVAIEMLHAYTLVHDDLPAMDDDDTRRGKPATHIAYGEAAGILVGDALVTHAFGVLADYDDRCASAVRILATRAGALELLRGQALDIAESPDSCAALEAMHAGKTGALFAAACQLGALAARADDETCHVASEFGAHLGLAFQHADDIDDDEFADYRDQSRARIRELSQAAVTSASRLEERPGHLDALARWFYESV